MIEPTITTVMVDAREPEEYGLLTYGGVKPVVTMLETADLWISTSDNALILVERKTVGDLVASIGDGRLMDQAASMKSTSPWSYLAVQGEIRPTTDGKTIVDGSRRDWTWASVQGGLQTVQELGVAIIYLSNDIADFQRFAVRLAKRDRSLISVRPNRNAEFLPDDLNILMSLPGIGLQRAKDLGRELPPAWAFEYLTDPTWTTNRIPGIGAGTKTRVRKALGLADGQRLAVVNEIDVPVVPPPVKGGTVELTSLNGIYEAVGLFTEGN